MKGFNMNNNFNEVSVIDQDILMTVDDFARQEGVSPRTVYRWIELGRLDVVERLGKKYVNASVPLKSAVNDIDNDRHDTDTKNVGALQQVNIFEEYLKTLRDNSKHYEKSCRRWQISCFASLFLFVAALLVMTALGLLYHYGVESFNGKINASAAELAKAESEKAEALAKLDDFNREVEAKVQPYKDENTQLRQRIDELAAKNDSLRDRLDETFDRNAILLQTIAERATIDSIPSAPVTMNIPENTPEYMPEEGNP